VKSTVVESVYLFEMKAKGI